MDTEVYLLCPVCKTITDGVGSGDLTDSVKCKNCSNDFISKSSIRYKKYQIDEKGIVTFMERNFISRLKLKLIDKKV
nr:hypothetical protein [Treponema sp.]